MSIIIDEALRLSKNGYGVIPIGNTKNPTIGSWREFQNRAPTEAEVKKYFNEETYGLALLMGGKYNLTTVDFDKKYFTKEGLYEEIVSAVPEPLMNKMKVAQTVSGGYHWVFSCNKIEGNLKLANRHTTDQEVMKTYCEEYTKTGDLKTSMKAASNDKVRVLIETRGRGGYIGCYPTPGYTWLTEKLHKITEEEYDTLLQVLRSFNEYTIPAKNNSLAKVKVTEEENPFTDFNENGNGLELLIESGWRVLDVRGSDHRLIRPGQVNSASSALWDSNRLILNVFSTSTSFEPGRGYTNTDILMELEDLDGTSAYKRLIEMGYGKH